MDKPRLLVVEDEPIVAKDMQVRLGHLGYEVVGIASTAPTAISLTESLTPDLVLMDVRLEGEQDGVMAAEEIRRRTRVPVVFVTAYGDEATLQRAKLAEPFGYVLKPFEDQRLRTAIEVCLQRSEAEKKVRNSERRYALTLASLGEAVISTDAEGLVTFVNPVAEKLTGWTSQEAVGRRIEDVFRLHAEETRRPLDNPVRAALRTRSSDTGSAGTLLVDQEGVARPIEARVTLMIDEEGANTGAVLVFKNISARRDAERERARLENTLLQARKWEGLGVLAAGVAHDFNNLLTTILGHAGLARMSLEADSKLESMMLEIEKAARRAADLTRQLLSYSGRTDLQAGPLDFSATIQGMVPFLKGLVHPRVSVDVDVQSGIWVEADPAQLKQVVVNLVTNADEAMADKAGAITLHTGTLDLPEPALYSPFASDEIRPGAFAFVEVADTGCGMSEQTVARMFDPFFTTKFVGRGLGMAAVLGIVRAHGGLIKVASVLNRGTSVQVLLPCLDKVG